MDSETIVRVLVFRFEEVTQPTDCLYSSIHSIRRRNCCKCIFSIDVLQSPYSFTIDGPFLRKTSNNFDNLRKLKRVLFLNRHFHFGRKIGLFFFSIHAMYTWVLPKATLDLCIKSRERFYNTLRYWLSLFPVTVFSLIRRVEHRFRHRCTVSTLGATYNE